MSNKLILALVTGALATGWGIGYYTTPSEVIIKENIIVKRDVVTKWVKRPDGTEEKTETDKSTEETSKSSETKRKKLDWTVSAAYIQSINGQSEIVGSIYKRVIGTVSIGLVGSSQGMAGLGIQFQF